VVLRWWRLILLRLQLHISKAKLCPYEAKTKVQRAKFKDGNTKNRAQRIKHKDGFACGDEFVKY
jgi:hypothetical protein